MGRFDALTTIDKKLEIAPPPRKNPETLKTGFPENLKSGNQENPLSGKPVFKKSGNQENVKNEKYSTLLHPLLIKQIKQYALEHDMKDYEVIQQAVQGYLESKKTP